ncbi:MAG: hypothetical protein H7Y11_10455 [Armatimonadetes bacterium]|nr:hypothetical protein [Anaerolineae bacterium]
MCFQSFAAWRLPALLLIGFCVLFMPTHSSAQAETPAPQFLYRRENRLVLLNGYTGEATELPLDVGDFDTFVWSPDGKYLLALLDDDKGYRRCLNLYDVDAQAWVASAPISCGVSVAVFSADGTQIAYAYDDTINATLRLYNLADETSQELYRTTNNDAFYSAGLSSIQWSPTKTYLTFVEYQEITGGSLNTFVVMNFESRDYVTLSAPATYYASYDPIWSADDGWFLIRLKAEYVTSGSVALTNHQGDVYLINSATGEQYRLTYSPGSYEHDVRWLDNGSINIALTVLSRQDLTYTIEQATRVEEVPFESIVMPEPFDVENFYNPKVNITISPDNGLGAWVAINRAQQTDSMYELKIGNIIDTAFTANFAVPLPANYASSSILIGWRPSDYPYPQR